MGLRAADAQTVADRFGLGDRARLTGPVARGVLGQVWRVETIRGAWAVKQPFARIDPAVARADAAFQQAALDGGVPLPRPVRTRDGDVLVDLGGAQVRVFDWVDLDAPDRRLDPATVGRLVATIHRIHHVGPTAVDGWYADPVGAAAWDALVRLLRREGADFADGLGALRDELVAMEALMRQPRQVQTCHRDLFADNVRTVVGDGAVCVIDWDNSGPAEPGQELAVVLFEFGYDDPQRMRTLYQAYRDAGGPGRVMEPGDCTMLIAQLGHLTAHACRAWLDATTPDDRAYQAARVDEFLSEPHTRDTVTALLDAVSA